ncbi:sensor histidine kinase [Mucilaginibacter pocheonensis]|uniref:Sensor histidine kinase YesM n=1 Tax=Mucilaginibacter pocheonensis TaxID=398050 RepID=A0ABU1T7Q2_9SPHI|nr:histidine kinase [Mucilaginibacter pocheonensis]MDR6941436.1 sensor histidine kinase YesM [Mucilaginibacter pocheonensis]
MSALSTNISTKSWLFKYKLYHIPFWCVYHYMWWLLAVGNPVVAASSMFFSAYSVKILSYVIFQALAVYFNLYFLIPRFLEKNRLTEYIIYLAITIVCASSLINTGYYLSAFLAGCTVKKMFGPEAGNFSHFYNTSLPSTVASMTLAMSIKLTKNWIQTERRQQLLEKEKLETELKFLKYQFNPHFLFNSINSIFFLIHKNPDMASASLAKFSELLRYQLYECNDQQISLNKELAYLENFIELEKLRQNNDVNVTFDLDEPVTDHLEIAPFILMTFVENAFKHVSKHTGGSNWINIKLTSDQQQLHLFIANSTSPGEVNEVLNYGGIGLKNVKRRLDLIYPGQYVLDIQNSTNRFEVRLQLTLAEMRLPSKLQIA